MQRRQFNRMIVSAAASAAFGAPREILRTPAPLQVNGRRLNDHLGQLAEFGQNPQGGVTRLAFSDADRAARARLIEWLRDAKLETSIDAPGNIVGRRSGQNASSKPIMFGSHIESVPQGGNYDGDVGSMAAIEVAQTLAEQGVATRHPLEVSIWMNEEGGLYGSRA